MKSNTNWFLKEICLLAVLLISAQSTFSQVSGNRKRPWSVGLSLNIIDDSGKALSNPFNFDDNYHFSRPFRLFIEKRYENEWGIELSATTNRFEVGKRIGNRVLEEPINYFAIDLAAKYYVSNKIISKYRSYFEIYLFAGFGRNFYGSEGVTTFNGGPGLTIYIFKNLRLFAQPTAKIPIRGSNERTKFLQYDFGLIYGIPW